MPGSPCGASWWRKGGRFPKSGLQVTRGKTCFLAAGYGAEMEGKEVGLRKTKFGLFPETGRVS